mgnify:CR=1 FL=1
MTGPTDDHTCGQPCPHTTTTCPCTRRHGHPGNHMCQHGAEWGQR